MPSNYTGDPSTTVPHETVVIACPVGTDAPNAASVNTPMQKLANLVAFLMKYAPAMGTGAENDQNLELLADLVVGGKATINSALEVTGEAAISNYVKSGAPVSALEQKLVNWWPGYGGTSAVRRYTSGADANSLLSINAAVEEGNWTRDDATKSALLLYHFNNKFEIRVWRVGDATPFSRAIRFEDSGISFIGTAVGTGEANPLPGDAVKNKLVVKSIPKSHGLLQFRGSTTPKEYTVLDGVNVESLGVGTYAVGIKAFRVTFAEAMADALYQAFVQVHTAYGAVANIVARQPGYFEFQVRSFNADGSRSDEPSDSSSIDFTIDFEVKGRQDS